MTTSDSLDLLRSQRFQFLRAVYDESEGSSGLVAIPVYELGHKFGFDDSLTDNITYYLVHEGLLEWGGMGVIELTHWGLKEVEEALSAPDEPTEHFLPVAVTQNFLHVASMSHSQIQQGTTASIQVIESGEIDQLRALVTEAREALATTGLSADQLREVEADLATVETQLDSPRPKSGIIRESLNSTRSVLEGALGSGLAIAGPQLPGLIERLSHTIASLSL